MITSEEALLGGCRNLIVGCADEFVGVRTVSTEKISLVQLVLRSKAEMSGNGMRVDQ
jgi:hypothetical protein